MEGDASNISKKIANNVTIDKVKKIVQDTRSDILTSLEQQLNDKIETCLQNIEKLGNSTEEKSTGSWKKSAMNGKVFVARPSMLSELLEINHIRTIYHIFIAILIVFMLNTFAFDVLDQGKVVLDFQLIISSFGKLPLVISLWLCMALGTTLVVYPAFHYWAHNRGGQKIGAFDIMWLLAYLVYQGAFLYLPINTILANNIPSASSIIISSEQVRFFMKTHAFVRENLPKVLSRSSSVDEDPQEPLCPDFTKFLYFLFAPTLIYRDEYPRSPGPIRWNYVMSNFIQVIACLFYIYYIFERFCIPVFRNFDRHFVTIRYFVVSVFSCMLPATLLLFITFFAILHSWLNAFAEMLRFADRLFYKDWWNSSSFSNYYRTWNVVVHDWLYTYVYQDCYRLIGKTNRAFPMATVFLLSALVHEYILSMSFGFVYPILFIMFAGAGFAFIFLPSKSQISGNVFMWVALFIGNGMLMCLYSMEWYARKRCPAYTDSFIDYFIPRSWFCDFNAIQPYHHGEPQQQDGGDGGGFCGIGGYVEGGDGGDDNLGCPLNGEL